MSGVERGEQKNPTSEPTIVERRGLGRFTTAVLFEDPSGQRLVWSSRRNRKGLDPEPAHLSSRSPPRHLLPISPGSLTWWIAVLFMIGSALFAVGSGSALLGTSWAGSGGSVFFVGSLFFTSAAYLQLLEVVNEPDALSKRRPSISLWRWEPHKIGWWAVVVQLLGTLLFNMNTFEAMQTLSPIDQDRLVWAPDAIGSICFLAASYLAYAEICHRWIRAQPRNISWWVAVINLLGSAAFGISAAASVVVIQTGELLSAYASNLWTLVGAVCFFVGAYLLLPEMTSHSATQAP
jgi:hypothetical protein